MIKNKLNILRYLTFESNRTCDMSNIHSMCPVSHPERYKFGDTTYSLTDAVIIDFWKWCRFDKGFRGIVLWSYYNEPTLVIDRIYGLMDRIKSLDPDQPFRLLTNKPPTQEMEGRFDLIKFTNYDKDPPMDERSNTIRGEGRSYSQVQRTGWCGRGFGWDVVIDNHGNWNLCCIDWRCEESVGNIFKDDWEKLLQKYALKARTLRWDDEESYLRLPRLCRACMEMTPAMHRSGGI